MTVGESSAPAPLSINHKTEAFDSGELSLNSWLKRRAHRNEISGASRTFVVCVEHEVVGYYCLSSGSIDRAESPKLMQRNMPDPIPVVVMGRLAIDTRYQGKGLGKGLLRDAMVRTLQVAEIVGVRAILLHAISEEAKAFYRAHGFLESPISPMTLCMPVETIRQALAE